MQVKTGGASCAEAPTLRKLKSRSLREVLHLLLHKHVLGFDKLAVVNILYSSMDTVLIMSN